MTIIKVLIHYKFIFLALSGLSRFAMSDPPKPPCNRTINALCDKRVRYIKGNGLCKGCEDKRARVKKVRQLIFNCLISFCVLTRCE